MGLESSEGGLRACGK